MSLLSVWMLELSLYTHGPLLRTMKFQLFFFFNSHTELSQHQHRRFRAFTTPSLLTLGLFWRLPTTTQSFPGFGVYRSLDWYSSFCFTE